MVKRGTKTKKSSKPSKKPKGLQECFVDGSLNTSPLANNSPGEISPADPKPDRAPCNRKGKPCKHKLDTWMHGSNELSKDYKHDTHVINQTTVKRKGEMPVWPDMGSSYSGRLKGTPKAPPDPVKGAIKKFLYRKGYKNRTTNMSLIQEALIGEAFLSKWFYYGMAPYIGVSSGWIRITRAIPFKFIPLVLQQLMYVPSTIRPSSLLKLVDHSLVNWTPVRTYNSCL